MLDSGSWSLQDREHGILLFAPDGGGAGPLLRRLCPAGILHFPDEDAGRGGPTPATTGRPSRTSCRKRFFPAAESPHTNNGAPATGRGAVLSRSMGPGGCGPSRRPCSRRASRWSRGTGRPPTPPAGPRPGGGLVGENSTSGVEKAGVQRRIHPVDLQGQARRAGGSGRCSFSIMGPGEQSLSAGHSPPGTGGAPPPPAPGRRPPLTQRTYRVSPPRRASRRMRTAGRTAR